MTFAVPDMAPKSISEVLKSAMADTRAPIQTLAWKIKRSPSTVKKWWSGKSQPSAADLIHLMREFDEVSEAVFEMAGRDFSAETLRLARKQIIEGLNDNQDL